MEVIYPASWTKYYGSISKIPGHPNALKQFQARIEAGGVKASESFATREECEQWIKAKNIEHNMGIKNVVHKFEDRLEVLTKTGTFVCDHEDFALVEAHIWYLQSGYPCTRIGERIAKFHNLKMNFIPSIGGGSIDHCDQNKLNNRRANLRGATQKIQAINRGIKATNTSGITGIHYAKNGRWVASWMDAACKKQTKSFSCAKYGPEQAKQMAIAHRRMIETTLAHYINALAV